MVLLFFILGIIILTIGILLFSRTTIKIEKINKENNKKSFYFKISLCKYEKTIFTINISKEKLIKSMINNVIKVDKEKIEGEKIYYEDIKREFKKANIKLEKLDLIICIGVEDAVITAYIVSILYIIISNIIPHVYNSKNSLNEYKYNVIPVYNKNFSKLSLNCIISIKLVHIIYIIFLIWKGSKKNERTSNRKSYEYSYE